MVGLCRGGGGGGGGRKTNIRKFQTRPWECKMILALASKRREMQSEGTARKQSYSLFILKKLRKSE